MGMLRLLGWVNGLEGWLSLTALTFGLAMLLSPDWWDSAELSGWPITPLDIATVLFCTGLCGAMGLRIRWRWLRMQSSIIAFMAWGLLAVYDTIVLPHHAITQDAMLHAMLALGELAVYVRVLVGLDLRSNQLAGLVRQPRSIDKGE